MNSATVAEPGPRVTGRASVFGLLAASYAVGVVGTMLASTFGVMALFGGYAALMIAAPVLLAAGIGVLAAAAAGLAGPGPAPVTPMLAHRSGRLAWAAWVCTGGASATIGLAVLWSWSGVPYPGSATFLLAGLPFLVMAALTLPGLPRLIAVVVVGVAVTLTWVVVGREQRERRISAAVEAAGPRELLYTASLPGYRAAGVGAGISIQLTPTDQSTVRVWQERDVLVQISDGSEQPVRFPDCGPTQMWAPEPWPPPSGKPAVEPVARCTSDGPGLWYRQASDRHEYVRLDGRVVIRADAGRAVDRTLLRAAVLEARPATDDDIDRHLVPHPERGP